MKVSGKVLFDGVLVAIFAVMVVMSFGYNPEARLVPLVVGIPTLVLSLIQFLADGVPALSQKLRFTKEQGVSAGDVYSYDHDQEGEKRSEESVAVAKKAEIKRAMRVFGWLVLLTLMLGLLNYLICVPAFILLFMLFEAKAGFRTSLFVAAGTEGFIFLLFGVFLQSAF